MYTVYRCIYNIHYDWREEIEDIGNSFRVNKFIYRDKNTPHVYVCVCVFTRDCVSHYKESYNNSHHHKINEPLKSSYIVQHSVQMHEYCVGKSCTCTRMYRR